MSIRRGVLLKGVADAAAKVGGLITLPVLIRFAGADGYGAYSQVNTIVGFLVPFAALGLAGSIVRFFSTEAWTGRVRTQFIRVVGLAGIATLVPGAVMIATAAWLNATFIHWEHGRELIAWGAGLIVAAALEQVVLELLRARQLIVQYALFQLVQTGLTVLATVVLLPLGFGLVVLLQVVIGIDLLLVVAMLVGLWWWNRPQAQGGAPGPNIGAMMRFGFPVAVSGLGLWMMNVGDRLVVGHYLTPAALGRYTAVYTFASLLLALNAPLNLPLYPMLMNAVASKDSWAVASYVRRFHRYATLALVPAAVGLIAFINPVLGVVGGEGFRVGMLVIVFVVFAVFLDQWNAVAQYSLMCVDQVKFIRNAWLGFGIVNVLANIVIVPLLGLTGAGLVSFATFLVLEVAIFLKAGAFYPLRRFYRFDVALKAGMSAVLAAGAAAVLLRLTAPGVPAVVLAAALFAAIYGALLVVFGEVGMAELHDAARLLGVRVQAP